MKPWSHFTFFYIVYHWARWELMWAVLQTSYPHWWEVYANGYHNVWAVINEMLKWMLWFNGPQPPLCGSTPKDLSSAQLSSAHRVSVSPEFELNRNSLFGLFSVAPFGFLILLRQAEQVGYLLLHFSCLRFDTKTCVNISWITKHINWINP